MSGDEPNTVLIVEDQEGLAEAYTTVLAAEYETRTATSGAEALEKIDETVDVVILDRRMPGMSGDEVLAAFVERGITAKVAMLTAVEPDVDIVDMSFDDYVTKPIDNDALIKLVDTLLERSEYDERTQRFFRLAAKRTALERADRQNTVEYDEVVDRMEELRAGIETTLEAVDQDIDPSNRSG